MKEITIIKNLNELDLFAKTLLEYLSENNKQKQTIAFSGDLGAGKTATVQALAKCLGINEVVTSPTFTIMKQYQIQRPDNFKQLIHIDAYRIESMEELRPLRLDNLIKTEGNLICIEWAERISNILPNDTIFLRFKSVDENTREVVFKA
jgi:tRNA threonylcarbamoyladenosine biosynthesis protein TsaE